MPSLRNGNLRELFDLPSARHLSEVPWALQDQGCSYVITWEQTGDVIVARETRGSHEFLSASRNFVFQPGQGYVGRLLMADSGDSSGVELLEDISSTDIRQFLRKQAALISGISSILFVRRGQQLLELGYEDIVGEQWSFPLFQLNHQLAADQFRSPIWLAASHDLDLSMPRTPMSCRSSSKSLCGSDRPETVEVHIAPKFQHDTALVTELETMPGFAVDSGAATWPSVGSEGHPESCKLPCKYFCKPKGCKSGEACLWCHLCPLTRSSNRAGCKPLIEWDAPQNFRNEGRVECPMAGMPPMAPSACNLLVPSPSAFPDVLSIGSIGSIGHPHSCQRPCKYASKRQGCYNGKICERCHFCPYTRASNRG